MNTLDRTLDLFAGLEPGAAALQDAQRKLEIALGRATPRRRTRTRVAGWLAAAASAVAVVAAVVLLPLGPMPALAFSASSLGIAGYLALIYRFAVVRHVKRRYIPGAIVATIIGLLGSFLFAYYVTNMGRYALFYGSLAVIVLVLLWLWLWCSAILIGAEINAALEDATDPRASGSTSPHPPASHGDGAGPTHTPSAVGKPDGD